MILRKASCICLLLLVAKCQAEDNPKTYDTSEWIPISPQKSDEEEAIPVVARKATGRVLNLAEPPQGNFFPDDNKPRFLNQQQFLRETTNINPYQQQPLQSQRIEGQRLENQRLESQRLESQRLESQRLESQRLESQRQEGSKQQSLRQLKVKPTVGHPYRFENIVPPPPPRTRTQQQKTEQTQQKFFVQQPKEYINQQFIQQQSKQEFNNQFLQTQPPQQIKFNPPNFAPGQPQFAAQTGGPFFGRPQDQPEYHTIPEEYLNAQGLQQSPQFQFQQQNYQNLPVNIPEFPPIRLNASYASIREAIEKEKVKPNSKLNGATPNEKENVQLLYVPLESLQQQQQQKGGKNDLPKLHAYQQAPELEIQQQFAQSQPPQFVHRQQQIQNIENDFARQALEAHKLQLQFQEQPQFQEQTKFLEQPKFQEQAQFQEQAKFQEQPQFQEAKFQEPKFQEPKFQEQAQFQALPQYEAIQKFQSELQQFPQFQQIESQRFPTAIEQPYALPIIETTTQPIYTTTTTTKRSTSKKRKPHQPPLAVYMGGEGGNHADVSDVLTLLRDAKTIDVQDTVGPNSPKIFVGPSTLDAPHGYAKFELPYLSSLDNNRVERKVDQYPFFVAPLSYKAPPGFSKIPLPSPHVGSVVIKENLLSKPSTSQRPTQFVEEYVPPQRIRTHTTRIVEPYTLPPISTPVHYSKPIPEEHVINHYELDQINGFVPQFQLQPSGEEAQYEIEPTRGHQRGTTPQPQQYLKEVTQPANKFVYESSTQEPRPTRTRTTQVPQYEQQVHKSHRPSQHHIRQRPKVTQEDSSKSVEVSDEEVYNKRPLHKSRRPTTTTSAPQEQYFKEVIRSSSPAPQEHFKEVTRSSSPASVQEQYFKEVTRSSSPSPIVQEQYFKEVTRNSSPAPVVQEQYFKEVTRSSTQAPQNYYEEITRSSSPNPQEEYFKEISRSSSPEPPQQNQYFETTGIAPQEQFFKEVTIPAPQEQYFKETSPELTHTRSSTPTPIEFITSPKPIASEYVQRPTAYQPKPTSSDYVQRPTAYQPKPTSSEYVQRPSAPYQPLEDDVHPTQLAPHQKFNLIDEYINKATNKNAFGSSEEQENAYKTSSEEIAQPIYAPNSLQHQNQHILNQNMMDTFILGQRQQDNYVSGPQQIYEESVLNHPQREATQMHRVRGQYRPDTSYEDINVKTQNANIDHYNLSPQLPPVSQQLPGLINNLEDHLEDSAIRQLLSPGLYPTSEKPNAATIHLTTPSPTHPPTTPPPQTTTPSYPSTHLPIIEKTTTQRILRGRQRAGSSRYSTTTPSSASTTKRTIRRRPLAPRTRYTEDATTEYVPTTARTVTSNRQRFRTRGRPTSAQSDATSDRVSTTERHSYEVPTRSTNNYEQVTSRQTATARLIDLDHLPQSTPKVTINDEEEQYVINNYHAVNADHTNDLPINQKVINVEVTRPPLEVTRARTEPAVIQEINHLPIRNLEEHQSTERPRVRNRIRSRPTIAPITTPKRGQASEEEGKDEFYGFFRQPNFKSSTEAPIQTTSARGVYSSTYVSSSLKPLIQYPDESIRHEVGSKYHQEDEIAAPVRFVGEIRPKYASTAQYFEATQPNLVAERSYASSERTTTSEAPKVKIRGRVRIPGRRPIATDVETTHSNELGKEETSMGTPVRGRVRGKVHYKRPTKPKDSVEDEDVEGGNYPVNYRKATPAPSFQITVDPAMLDDQEPYSSQYRPLYVTKEAGNKIVQPWVEDLSAYRHANELPEDNKPITTTEDSPNALPSVLTSTTEEVGTTTESPVEKLVEEIAELADEQFKTEEEPSKTFEEPSDTFKTFETFEDDTNKEEYLMTTDAPETSTKKRRGVWKLVKRPIDGLQSAESQNFGQSVNSFANEEKTEGSKGHIFEDNESTTPIPEVTTAAIVSTTEEGFLNSLYEMFGVSSKDVNTKDERSNNTKDDTIKDIPTETPMEINEDDTTEALITTGKTIEDVTTFQSVQQVDTNEEFLENTPSSLNYVTPMTLETWNKGVVKTLTSTEISHETEICYKGRCVKSKEMPLTTA